MTTTVTQRPWASNSRRSSLLPIASSKTSFRMPTNPRNVMMTMMSDASSVDPPSEGGDDSDAVTPAAKTVPDTKSLWKTMFGKKKNGGATEEEDGEEKLTTRQRLAKLGLAAVLSYGWVSNMSYCTCVSIAWYGFSKQTGRSPLAPGQWKPFLAVYSGFWIFNNFIRPFRFALAVGVSTYFDRFVNFIHEKTGLGRGWSIGLVVFLANVVGTLSFMCLGITGASILAGVPIWAPK